MKSQNHIVKRKGHAEKYDQRKLYASIYAACQSVRVHGGESELVAERVCQDVEKWLDNKNEVTAEDIRIQATQHLAAYNEEAAWMYGHHRAHIS